MAVTETFLELYSRLREANRELKTAVENGEDEVGDLIENYVQIQIAMIKEAKTGNGNTDATTTQR